MEHIEINEENYNFENLYKDAFVDLDKEPIKPNPIVYIGIDFKGKRVEALTKGEYSLIVGASKSKKTFFKSLIVGAYIGGKTVDYTTIIESNRTSNKTIIDIDTEQGKYYAHRTFNRTRRLVGGKYDNYFPFGLRKLSPEDRLKFIEDVLLKHGKETDLVFIDGLADLLNDVNDLAMSNEVTSKILKWTSEYNLHICAILHKNFNSSKPTGHVGSASLKKAETVIFVNKITNEQNVVTDKNFVKITCEYSRGISFEAFYMGINDMGLPFTISENEYLNGNKQEDIVPF